jgi:hypothetical protein
MLASRMSFETLGCHASPGRARSRGLNRTIFPKVRPQITNMIQRSYPIILGRRLNFTLPPSAEGASIEAEVNGEQIVFPLGPTASLSWASCEVRTEKDQTKVYRCELRPEYGLKDRGGE